MIMNVDQYLLQGELNDGSMEIDDIIAAFCGLAAVLRANGQDPITLLQTP